MFNFALICCLGSRRQAPPVLAQGRLGGAEPEEGGQEGAELDSGVRELGGVDQYSGVGQDSCAGQDSCVGQESCVGGVHVVAVQLGQLQFLVGRVSVLQ